MAGPWEQYQSAPAEAGPWAQYSQPNASSASSATAPVPFKVGMEGLPDAMRAVVGDFHPAAQALAGIGGALDDLSTRAGQAWAYANRGGPNVPAPELTPQQQMMLQTNRAMYDESPMSLLGNIGTQALLTRGMGPLYNAVKSGASAVLPSFAQFAAPTAGGAAVGAATAATQPTLPNESTAGNMGVGATAGGILDALTRGGSRLIQPITQSPAVKKLLDYDVVPTVGSAAGGVVKSVEDKLTSLPFVGDFIKNRQLAAREELNAAALKLGTPAGRQVTSIGKEGIEQGKDAFNTAYGDVYKGSQIGLTMKLEQDIAKAKTASIIPLSSEESKQFDQIIQREVHDRLSAGPVPTDEAKMVIEKNLGAAAAKAQGPLQDALKEAKNAFRSAMGRSVGSQGAAELTGIDKAYSNFMDVKKAAQAAEGNGGVATPRQIQRAAKPGGELKSLADAAQSVLPPSIPNSGSTDRALLNWLLLSSGAMGANQYGGQAVGHEGPVINPALLAALAFSPAMYSRMGTQYMLGNNAIQPALSQAMRQTAPYAAQAGALYAPYR